MKKKFNTKLKFTKLNAQELKSIVGGGDGISSYTLPPLPPTTVGCDRLSGGCGRLSGW